MGQEVSAQAALRYRQPMQVRELAQYHSGGIFPVCPQCGSAMEREYQSYCDRCGQRLGWREISRAQIVDRK